ncbi:hypothetical protein V494_06067 [Pseudogymnoascus sp. VKM F-4513 (FW-928)]|nr:hypothetical protein V494_06067 [Pseudogymnoascus sp. VKM F-4513 (FW-928)]
MSRRDTPAERSRNCDVVSQSPRLPPSGHAPEGRTTGTTPSHPLHTADATIDIRGEVTLLDPPTCVWRLRAGYSANEPSLETYPGGCEFQPWRLHKVGLLKFVAWSPNAPGPTSSRTARMTKLICIVGVTGNQGGSVAQRFLRDPNYRVRGITRHPSSTAAQALAAQGVEVVAADLDDAQTLISAFAGANLVFSVTNYWEPFFRPDCRARAQELGVGCRRYAYDVEVRQGRNIADAVMSTADSLDENGFIASTLSHAGTCSGGKFEELYHFHAKADVFPGYLDEKYPGLAGKTSYVHTGYFMSSYKLLPAAYLGKQADGTFQMSLPTTPDASIPHLAVNADMGNFVYAVSQMPPGKKYMAAGSECSWSEFIRLWSRQTGVSAKYKQVSIEEFSALAPDEAFGAEAGDMFAYSSDPGYDGGDRTLLKAEDIRKAGIECPMTSLEEYMRKEDWSAILGQ